MRAVLKAVWSLAIVGSLVACSRAGAPEEGGGATATSTATPTSTPTTPSTSTPRTTTLRPSRPSSEAGCGGAPCTLDVSLKLHEGDALATRDFAALADELDGLAEVAPERFPNWASIARDGAEAARVEDVNAVKAACRACHNFYEGRYQSETHGRAP